MGAVPYTRHGSPSVINLVDRPIPGNGDAQRTNPRHI